MGISSTVSPLWWLREPRRRRPLICVKIDRVTLRGHRFLQHIVVVVVLLTLRNEQMCQSVPNSSSPLLVCSLMDQNNTPFRISRQNFLDTGVEIRMQLEETSQDQVGMLARRRSLETVLIDLAPADILSGCVLR